MAIGETLNLEDIIKRDNMAAQLSNRYSEWKSFRDVWEKQKQELRNYEFATDTTTTSNSKLPWKNKTTIPKLCQIRDNLHANYMAALFPNDDWMKWEGDSEEDADKAQAIEAYMKNKTKQSGFKNVVSQLVYDYIDYGNAFADVEFVAAVKELPDTGETVTNYVGPMLVRLSPLDIVFNPTASSFENSPKITRVVMTLGDLAKDVKTKPEMKYREDVFDHIASVRQQMNLYDSADALKGEGYQVDGFSDIKNYYESGYVELLEFEGDWYDIETNTLYADQRITVVDRTHIIRQVDNPSWIGGSSKRHVGWRLRPDNIYAMGPLDNLVGMQYRIDHLENLKADVFDIIAHPPLKIRGYVEDFDWEPFQRIYVGDDGDVTPLTLDPTALNADFQIDRLENKMEEMAGAPRQAMGIRTPGEKTAYEVQTLENASGRIFQDKVGYFEERFLEPLLNVMLENAKRNLDVPDVVRVMDSDLGVEEFLNITKDDITAKGKIRPMGARHFARRAQMVQNITNFANSPLGQDPAVMAHISGKKIAFMFEDLLDLEKFDIVRDNIRLEEQMETQKLARQMEEELAVAEETPLEEDNIPIDEQS